MLDARMGLKLDSGLFIEFLPVANEQHHSHSACLSGFVIASLATAQCARCSRTCINSGNTASRCRSGASNRVLHPRRIDERVDRPDRAVYLAVIEILAIADFGAGFLRGRNHQRRPARMTRSLRTIWSR